METNNNSGNESSSKQINLSIIVDNNGKIELVDAQSRSLNKTQENAVRNKYKHTLLEIRPDINKENIILFIKERIKSNEYPDNYSANQANQLMRQESVVGNKIENTKNNKSQTQQTYVEYNPDENYNKHKNNKHKNKGTEEEFTDIDVMIYLSEIRRNNEGKVPDYLKSFHDELYNAIDKKGIKNNKDWVNITDDKGNNAKEIFNKIYEFESSNRNILNSNKYKTVKSELDAAFSRIFSINKDKTPKVPKVPKVYHDALESMKKAIDSHTAFKYPTDTDIIFDKDHIYSKDDTYKIMQTLTRYLNRTIFDRFDNQTPDNNERYPPSIRIDYFSDNKCLGTKKITGNRNDDCFEIFKDSEDGKDGEVVRFLRFISSVKPPVINKKKNP